MYVFCFINPRLPGATCTDTVFHDTSPCYLWVCRVDAVDIVRHSAVHQFGAGVEPQEGGRMTMRSTHTTASIGLTVVALAFLGIFVALPLVTVFVEALSKGIAPYLSALADPDRKSTRLNSSH